MKLLIKFVFASISLAFIGCLFVFGMILYISFDLPQINSLDDYQPALTSRIYSKDGQVLLEVGKERREIIEFEKIPARIVHSFLSAEDDNFYNHSGIDYIGIARAMLKNLKAGRIVQGASTITQQVAKSLLLTNERTFSRKIKDLLLAKKIEDKFTKNEILFLYLNQVYLGGGYYGIKAAFKGYFGKELEEATIAESALIAGLLVAPGKYSPYVNPKYAKTRQRYVLKRMFVTEKITKAEYEEALVEDIKLLNRKYKKMRAGHFTDWVRQQVIEELGEENFLTGGFEIYTTIDWNLQSKAEEEVESGLRSIDKRQGFKGPIKELGDDEQIQDTLVTQQMEFIDAQNTYFTLMNDGTKKESFVADKEVVKENIIQNFTRIDSLKSSLRKYIHPGGIKDDSSFLENYEYYRAVVLQVSNSSQIIYAAIGNQVVFIPYDGFRWAHERDINENRNYWSWVKYPETIVKRGDVIDVKIVAKNRNIYPYFKEDFKTLISKTKEIVSFVSSENYHMAYLEQVPEVEGALLSISPRSGEIKALVGGRDFNHSQFNRVVQSNRQPGSAFKPLIFAKGLEEGYTASTMLMDSPHALGGADASLSWKPRNYDGKFKGKMSFRRALETSRNIPTILLTQDIGVEKMVDFVTRLKLNAVLPKDLSISLGSFGMNLLDIVKGYAIFPNGGRKIKLKSIISIKDRFGKVYHLKNEPVASVVNEQVTEDDLVNSADEEKDVSTEESEPTEKINPYYVNLNDEQVYDERLAYIMTNLLKGVIQNGTGRSTADVSPFIGGKTGTTNNYVDAWFLGFSNNLVTGVWTGFDNNQTLGWGETGAKAALPIWKEFMKEDKRLNGESDFKVPKGIVNVLINKKTGKLAEVKNSSTMMESFVDGTQDGVKDTGLGEGETESSGQVLYDEDYYENQ